MTPLAITFMIIAVIVIWGGLAVSLVFLARHPLPPEQEPEAATGAGGDPDGRRGRGPEPMPGQWPGRRG